jgi:hypothetical protein
MKENARFEWKRALFPSPAARPKLPAATFGGAVLVVTVVAPTTRSAGWIKPIYARDRGSFFLQ